MPFIPLSKILPRTIQKFGLTRQARAALVCERYRKIAAQIFTPQIQINAWPKYYKNKTLVIGVNHPAYATEVIQQKEKILQFLNEKCEVKDIRTKVEKSPEAPSEI